MTKYTATLGITFITFDDHEVTDTTRKIRAIKALRACGIIRGLREAKEFVEQHTLHENPLAGRRNISNHVEVLLTAEQVANWAVLFHDAENQDETYVTLGNIKALDATSYADLTRSA
jgi:hypothetical protein